MKLRWTQLKSALPKEYDHILAWDGETVIKAYLVDTEAPFTLDSWRISHDGDGMWPMNVPTHWSPLPAGPLK